MRRLTVFAALAAAITLTTASPASAHVQGLGARLKKKAEEAAKRKVEERTEKRAGEATDKALDTVECAASDKVCAERAQAEGKTVVTSDGSAASPATGAASMKPGEGMWVNYDFVPGARTIFFEDFSKDNVGDFPRRFDLVRGNVEVSERAGQRYLRTSEAQVSVTLPEVLPERFTLEFDLEGGYGTQQTVGFAAHGHNYVVFAYRARPGGHSGWGGVVGGSVSATGEGTEVGVRPMRARVMADGRYVKVYVDDTRVANVPNANLGRSNKIVFGFNGRDHDPALITNILVAAGGKKLYDALAEKGRVSTQGIYFDTGSDRIRPESTPTLKEIGQMLTEHADLKLTIEGHTDNVGNAPANQDLSQRRAAAVKTYLVAKHGVDSSRLSSAGFGDKKPAAPNTTPEGRQQNRRVELVKM